MLHVRGPRRGSGGASAELLIPDVIQGMIDSGAARVRVLRHDGRWCGITFTEDRHRQDNIRTLAGPGQKGVHDHRERGVFQRSPRVEPPREEIDRIDPDEQQADRLARRSLGPVRDCPPLFGHSGAAGEVLDFHRAIDRPVTGEQTRVEADIDETLIDTVTANTQVLEAWAPYRADFPTIDLDLSGELDDIEESLDAIVILFVFGIGVMYAILGTQFRSYWQPLMILSTIIMAFTGVSFGLIVSGNPLSLYTLYGVVALAGIAVNAAIVLISAGNQRLAAGMSVLHATIYAARRRVIPILITSLTTVAGLLSLATGLGGKSLIWGPVATAIVWGLVFSTILTLIVIPVVYFAAMRNRLEQIRAAE